MMETHADRKPGPRPRHALVGALRSILMTILWLALLLLWLVVMIPIAFLFRLLARDSMSRNMDTVAATFWEPYRPTTNRDRSFGRYFRQL
jgi:hypothetical protein